MTSPILFVDDDPLVLHGILRAIKPWCGDWEVQMATNAYAALRILATRPFDALVTDLRMPGLDGADLSHEVRIRFPWMARIMLTGTNDPVAIARASTRTEQLLKKPCAPDVLAAAISLAIERRVRERAQSSGSAAHQAGTASGAGASNPPRGAADPIVVLVVDDDAKHVELLRASLAAARPGIQVRAITHDTAARSFPGISVAAMATPADRPESVAASTSSSLFPPGDIPHLVIVGIDRADTAGCRFLTRYRGSPSPQLPIVVIAASVREADIETMVRHGASAVIPKPWSPQRYAELAATLAIYADLSSRTGDGSGPVVLVPER